MGLRRLHSVAIGSYLYSQSTGSRGGDIDESNAEADAEANKSLLFVLLPLELSDDDGRI
jgi:hypothetical protein